MNCVSVSDELSVQKVDILDFSPEADLEDEILHSVYILDDKIVTVDLEDEFVSCG